MAKTTAGTAIPNPNMKVTAGQAGNTKIAIRGRVQDNAGSVAYRKLMGVAPYKTRKMIKIVGGKLES